MVVRIVMTMTNAQVNARFLALTDVKTKDDILGNIADHYGTSKDVILNEVTHEEAEHLLDYVTGPMRAATSVMMQRHGLGVDHV